jgi:crotonobetainyl-CoA:carnitine CoA-transferase CaiB-like acyl-CoA transferase
MAARRQNPEAMAAMMQKIYVAAEKFTTREVMERLEAEGAPCGVVLAPDQLAADPHAKAVGLLVDSEHPVAGRLRQPRPPVRFEKTPARLGGPAPTLGQQTDAILEELGLADEIEGLRADGIVG